MSIYSKQVTDLTIQDINDLQTEGAQENIRLEFKREFPEKDETLKKVSSMANTYGGYIIIGASEDGKGNLKTLSGVPTARGNKQKLIQWCFDGISPPVVPVVKEIVHDRKPTLSFYVLYVQESRQAPHFINNRKGCYIRTDEFSQRFEPRLANYEEIRFLMNRREEAVSLRDEIIDRAHRRFKRNTSVYYRKDLKYFATMSLAVSPYYPGPFSLEINDLKEAILDSRLSARGGIRFPPEDLKSALDSFYHEAPRVGLAISYFEANVQGLLFYGQAVAERAAAVTEKKKIRSDRTFAWLIFYLKYADKFYRNAGYDGSLHIKLDFDNLEGTSFTLVRPDLSDVGDGKQLAAELDDRVNIILEKDTRMLREQEDILMRDLVRRIGHAFGWKEAFGAEDRVVDTYIDQARSYLRLGG